MNYEHISIANSNSISSHLTGLKNSSIKVLIKVLCKIKYFPATAAGSFFHVKITLISSQI